MRKFEVIGVIILGIYLVSAFGTCIYFVEGVSSTSPPIKTYDYPGSFRELKVSLDHLCTMNHNISYVVTDTVGGPKYNNSYAYYITVKVKTSATILEFRIKYSLTDYWFAKNKSFLSLIMAYDTVHNIGGYSLKGDGVTPIIEVFEKDIISSLLRNIKGRTAMSLTRVGAYNGKGSLCSSLPQRRGLSHTRKKGVIPFLS